MPLYIVMDKKQQYDHNVEAAHGMLYSLYCDVGGQHVQDTAGARLTRWAKATDHNSYVTRLKSRQVLAELRAENISCCKFAASAAVRKSLRTNLQE